MGSKIPPGRQSVAVLWPRDFGGTGGLAFLLLVVVVVGSLDIREILVAAFVIPGILEAFAEGEGMRGTPEFFFLLCPGDVYCAG